MCFCFCLYIWICDKITSSFNNIDFKRHQKSRSENTYWLNNSSFFSKDIKNRLTISKNTRFSEMNSSAFSPHELLYMCLCFLKWMNILRLLSMDSQIYTLSSKIITYSKIDCDAIILPPRSYLTWKTQCQLMSYPIIYSQ